VGTLYGITGTLNMADLAVKVAHAPAGNTALLRAGALLLLVVFALKSALLPLYFWLPSAYSSTSAPVAALFAIMTKVGVYAIVRVFTVAFGPMAGETANVAVPWLLPVALATLVAGTFGALASRDLRTLLAYFVVVSIGTLLAGVGLFNSQALSAALLYLIHTTLVTAGMFLLADVIALQRGDVNEYAEPPVAQPLLLGMLFFTGAIAMAGMPPLSGFLGKFMILLAAKEHPALVWIWGIVLGTSLLGIVAFSRMGSALFWRTSGYVPNKDAMPLRYLTPVILLLVCSPLLVTLSGPVTAFTEATARQLLHPAGYLESVLGSHAVDVIDAKPKGAP
jgi:multicomponent K+:H+ antiporter subunit D